MSTVAAETTAPKAQAEHSGFVKAMTLTDATMLVAGSMIGSGIFIVSADISRSLPSPFWLLIAWVVTGVITLLGALAYGELAAMYPRAGGQYVFLRESLGPLMGFLYGWTLFLVIQTGTIAAVAVAFGRFLGVLIPAIGPDRYGWFPHVDFAISGRDSGAWTVPPTIDRARLHLGADRGSTFAACARARWSRPRSRS
jgi:APA family basic amino acid/polyamine antiporter